MSRLLLCIILIAFFALPSLTAGQNNANALTELLFDPDCPAACFLGIIPGQTISQTDLEAYLTATGATFEKRELVPHLRNGNWGQPVFWSNMQSPSHWTRPSFR